MPDHPLEVTDPTDPLFDHPLQTLNLLFADLWSRVSEDVAESIQPLIIAHSSPSGGRYELIHGDRHEVAQSVPPAFRIMKSVSHVPLAMAAMVDLGEDLTTMTPVVQEAIDRLESDPIDRPSREGCRDVLDRCLSVLGHKTPVDPSMIDQLFEEVEVTCNDLITRAGALQVETFTKVLERWRGDLGEEAWSLTRAIVGTSFSVTEYGVHYQILLDAFGEDSLGERLYLASNIKDDGRLRTKLGTLLANRQLCARFFGDAFRMDKELIGDAAHAALTRRSCPIGRHGRA